jgi:hypothetical protein
MRPLAWTIEAIGREFKLAQNTVRKILHQGGAEPDASGCYSTEQICACLFGDLRAERLRKERELTRKYRLENAIVEASVLDRASLSGALAMIADAMKSRMEASELSRAAKEDLLHDLASIPITLNGVADRQSALPRRRNGQTESLTFASSGPAQGQTQTDIPSVAQETRRGSLR